MQIFDTIHVNISTKEWMETIAVNHWATPRKYPDINPIEILTAMT